MASVSDTSRIGSVGAKDKRATGQDNSIVCGWCGFPQTQVFAGNIARVVGVGWRGWKRPSWENLCIFACDIIYYLVALARLCEEGSSTGLIF